MTTHRHHRGAIAWRMLLARFRGDVFYELESSRILIDELAGCPLCLFITADHLADLLARELRARVAEQEGITLDDVIRRLEWKTVRELDEDLFNDIEDECDDDAEGAA